ncbi:MAG TPA: SUF system NifU family Fe-S cluster assembly protein [Tepidisphaeraceae bacterium]|jgi:nitrogen fixation NifU-like protein|nr:SUF system NifU family Fe-S cluster assembly protein [Tepidisphaeraceae bacterium]
MPDELDDLYREVILDHSKRPRNFRVIQDATATAEGHNRLCGDRLTLYLKLDNGVIADASFQGKGCAIDTAAASMMTEILRGKTLAQAQAVFDRFHTMLTAPSDSETTETIDDASLGKLAAFRGVRKFPVRVKCATLPWHTFQAALKQSDGPASTE